MEDRGFCEGPEPTFLCDEIDAWMSFSMDDPGFHVNPQLENPTLHNNGFRTNSPLPPPTSLPDTEIPIDEPIPGLEPTPADGDLAALLFDDFDVQDDILTPDLNQLEPLLVPASTSEGPQPKVLSATNSNSNSPPEASSPHSSPPPSLKLNPMYPATAPPLQAAGVPDPTPASPPRSTSSSINSQGESLGSNTGKSKSPERGGSNGETSSAPGGCSSDGDHPSGAKSAEQRLPQVKSELPPNKFSSSLSVNPLKSAPSLTGPPLATGFQGSLLPMGSHPVGFPGYPMAPQGAPLMFRPLMPLSHCMLRRQRKSTAGTKSHVGGAKSPEGTEGSEQGKAEGGKERNARADKEVKGRKREGEKTEEEAGGKEVKAEPVGCNSPESGVSVEEGTQKKKSNGSDDSSDGEGGPMDADREKRQARLIRNRESAQLSRQRKKCYMEELEAQLSAMSATIAELNNTVAHLSAENVNLRRQLALFCPNGPVPPGSVGATAAGMSPMLGSFPSVPAGMHSTGIFGFRGLYAPTPVVPIPKLKPSTKKADVGEDKKRKHEMKEDKSVGAKGREGGKGSKRPKAPAPASKASMAVLGIFGFLMIVSPLLPSTPGVGSQSPSMSSALATRSWATFSSGFIPQDWGSLWSSRQFLRGNRDKSSHGRLLMSVLEEGGRVVVNSSSREHRHQSSRQQLRGRSSVPVWPEEKPIPLPGSSGNLEHQRGQDVGSVSSSKQRLRLGMNGTHGSVLGQSMPLPATLILPGEKGEEVEIDGQLIVRAVLAGKTAAKAGYQRRSIGTPQLSEAIPLGPVVDATKHEGVPVGAEHRGLPVPSASMNGAALLPHQLKYVAVGSVQGQSAASRMWALPEKASVGGRGVQDEKDGSEDFFSSGFRGSFIGSEMCTEVFQFEVKQFAKREADSSPMNASNRQRGDSTASGQPRGSGSDAAASSSPKKAIPASRRLGAKSERSKRNSIPVEGKNFPSNETAIAPTEDGQDYMMPRNRGSSMVVSILAGLENGEPAVKAGGGIRKIFVVVLVEGIKYVTYACHLPSFSVSSGASLIPV